MVAKRSTPRPRSGTVAEMTYPTSEVRGGSWLSYPTPEVGVLAERSYHTPEVRGAGQEEQPHVQGAEAAQEQEGQEELFYVQGQEGRL